jgi:hypothetical protein
MWCSCCRDILENDSQPVFNQKLKSRLEEGGRKGGEGGKGERERKG